MIRSHARVIAALCVGVALGACSPPQQKADLPETASAGTFSEIVGVATVSDGDTIRVGPRRIRLDGIIAPERRTMCGGTDIYRASMDGLREATRFGDVSCRISDLPDNQGRDVAQCHAGDVDLAQHMVENGWARGTGGAYAEQEAAARTAERGVWNPACPADLWRGRSFE